MNRKVLNSYEALLDMASRGFELKQIEQKFYHSSNVYAIAHVRTKFPEYTKSLDDFDILHIIRQELDPSYDATQT